MKFYHFSTFSLQVKSFRNLEDGKNPENWETWLTQTKTTTTTTEVENEIVKEIQILEETHETVEVRRQEEVEVRRQDKIPLRPKKLKDADEVRPLDANKVWPENADRVRPQDAAPKSPHVTNAKGEFDDQADDDWIVFRGSQKPVMFNALFSATPWPAREPACVWLPTRFFQTFSGVNCEHRPPDGATHPKTPSTTNQKKFWRSFASATNSASATTSPSPLPVRARGTRVSDRNFPCQTLKIRNVFLVVMGSYAPGRPIGCPGSGRPQGVIGVFLVTYLFFSYISGRPQGVSL
jgi:hypothetical protein